MSTTTESMIERAVKLLNSPLGQEIEAKRAAEDAAERAATHRAAAVELAATRTRGEKEATQHNAAIERATAKTAKARAALDQAEREENVERNARAAWADSQHRRVAELEATARATADPAIAEAQNRWGHERDWLLAGGGLRGTLPPTGKAGWMNPGGAREPFAVYPTERIQTLRDAIGQGDALSLEPLDAPAVTARLAEMQARIDAAGEESST